MSLFPSGNDVLTLTCILVPPVPSQLLGLHFFKYKNEHHQKLLLQTQGIDSFQYYWFLLFSSDQHVVIRNSGSAVTTSVCIPPGTDQVQPPGPQTPSNDPGASQRGMGRLATFSVWGSSLLCHTITHNLKYTSHHTPLQHQETATPERC